MRQDAVNFINNEILRQASKLNYTVSALAPSTEVDLFSGTGLVIWSGASDKSIYGDYRVNWAFRALHDTLHLKTGLGFDVDSEIELGRLQASQYTSDLMRELIYSQVSMQAMHYKSSGLFVMDDKCFTMEHLSKFRF